MGKNKIISILCICVLFLFVVCTGGVILVKLIHNGKQNIVEFEKEEIYIDRFQKEDTNIDVIDDNFVPTLKNVYALKSMKDLEKYLYAVDETAYVTEEDFDIEQFITRDFRTNLHTKKPKILIFHTHSQEDFIDSVKGVKEDTIIGVGNKLAEILTKDYNISVVHDIGEYDLVNGKLNITGSYERMEPAIRKILKKYPSIEIVIDLHRDGVPDGVHLVTEIEGKKTAKIMFFNGMATGLEGSSNNYDLENPYVKDNLALSLQMHLKANELYEGFTRRIYIRPYRYSLHFRPKSMLVEVGANTSTVEEAKNAMYPLAKLISEVLDK